jgi:hypothetical protein
MAGKAVSASEAMTSEFTRRASARARSSMESAQAALFSGFIMCLQVIKWLGGGGKGGAKGEARRGV